MANTVSTDALRREAWAKELYKDVIDNLFFTQRNMMGEGDNVICEVKSDLAKEKGDTVTFGLTAKLSGNGITGDSELEGQEEAISVSSESVAIDQIRNAVRLTGLLDEQKNSYDMRMDAKAKLAQWMQEFIEMQIMQKLSGVNSLILTDVNGTVVSARSCWSNTPTNYDMSTKYRYINANAAGMGSLATTDYITPDLITKAKIKAQTSTPMVRPLRVNGKDYYVLFIHPYQAYDLHRNATYAQAMREAQVRGNENPIFTGADAIWDGVIVHTHPYVQLVDSSAIATDKFHSSDTATDGTTDAYRALLCGRQAVAFAQCKNGMNANGLRWTEKKFDYDNKTGFAVAMIGGMDLVMFSSKQYGCVALDTSATWLG